MLIIGVTPTPPAINTAGTSDWTSSTNCPAGAFTFRMSPTFTVSCKKVEAAPGGRFIRPGGAGTRLTEILYVFGFG